ncbi:hypothetical protein Tco_0184516 [Tanacetum coccineum]
MFIYHPWVAKTHHSFHNYSTTYSQSFLGNGSFWFFKLNYKGAVDELTNFSGETEMEEIDNRDEVYDSLFCLRESKAAENNKLLALNDIIADAEEDISVKEGHVEMMDAAINSV